MKCHFGVRFWIKEYKFPTLGNKIWTQDFDEVELYNDSFFVRWRIVLSVASTKLFWCDCERQLWLYCVSLLSLKNGEIVAGSLSLFFFFLSLLLDSKLKRNLVSVAEKITKEGKKNGYIKIGGKKAQSSLIRNLKESFV